MKPELTEECPRGDLLQQIDDLAGPTIEKAIQHWLPRDIARKIRKEAIEFIGDQIRPVNGPEKPSVESIVKMYRELKEEYSKALGFPVDRF